MKREDRFFNLSRYHMFDGLCDFMFGHPSFTLSSVVTIGRVEVDIYIILFITHPHNTWWLKDHVVLQEEVPHCM